MQEIKHCLIIDDDEDDQDIFVMCLLDVNKNVDCLKADDGVEAIAKLKADEKYIPDYIFLDVNMPKMNGIECLKNLRMMERLNKTKIFMYSTTSGKAVEEESKKLGADKFIIKSSKLIDLKATLSELVV